MLCPAELQAQVRYTSCGTWYQPEIIATSIHGNSRTIPAQTTRATRVALVLSSESVWLRGLDLNQRPLGYEGNFGGHSPPLSTTKYLKSRPDADTVLALICGGSRTKHGQNADTIALPIEPHPARSLWIPSSVAGRPQRRAFRPGRRA